jgi:hypothetical protein
MPEVAVNAALRKMRRLTAMAPREIAHRLREKGYSQLQRLGVPLGSSEMPAVPFKDLCAGARMHRFYAGVVDGDRDFISHNFPQWIDRAITEAEGICRHEVRLLGYLPVTLGPEINWHGDPYSGKEWELDFWADFKPQDDAAGRDAKVITELNRQQNLPRLAKAWLWTGDERYAAEAIAQMESWIDQNPVGYGINWQSSLELAIRSVAWIWTIFLLLDSPAFKAPVAEKIGRSLFAQIQHVYRHLSTYTSPNTHLIGEAATLFSAGLLFGEHPSAEAWLSTGAAVLNQEAPKQILDGAVYGELSSWYHCYTVDFYMQAVILGRQNHRDLPAETEQALEQMLDFLMHLTRPDGTIPLLGDDDGGRALALCNRDYRSFREALALGAIVFKREDFRHQGGEYPEEAFWLLGKKGLETYYELNATVPGRLSVSYPNAGYAILRSSWEARASHLIFDFGGLGILTGGHAHADSLSLNLFSEGQELLVDPGTYVYNCQPEWRSRFRSTSGHNTVTVDGRDQTEMAGTFAWTSGLNSRGSSRMLQPATPRGDLLPPLEWLEGEHDGYAAIDVTHHRSLLHAPGDYWIVIDKFTGSGTHRLEFNYHFGSTTAPVLTVDDSDRVEVRTQGCEFLLGLFGSEPVEAKQSQSGWASSSYGEKHPIDTLRSTMRPDLTNGSAGAITLLITGSPAAEIRRLAFDLGQGVACAIERDGFTDIAVFTPRGEPAQVAGLRTAGEFFWMRLADGAVLSSVAVRAKSMEYKGLNLVEEAMCAQSAAS